MINLTQPTNQNVSNETIRINHTSVELQKGWEISGTAENILHSNEVSSTSSNLDEFDVFSSLSEDKEKFVQKEHAVTQKKSQKIQEENAGLQNGREAVKEKEKARVSIGKAEKNLTSAVKVLSSRFIKESGVIKRVTELTESEIRNLDLGSTLRVETQIKKVFVFAGSKIYKPGDKIILNNEEYTIEEETKEAEKEFTNALNVYIAAKEKETTKKEKIEEEPEPQKIGANEFLDHRYENKSSHPDEYLVEIQRKAAREQDFWNRENQKIESKKEEDHKLSLKIEKEEEAKEENQKRIKKKALLSQGIEREVLLHANQIKDERLQEFTSDLNKASANSQMTHKYFKYPPRPPEMLKNRQREHTKVI